MQNFLKDFLIFKIILVTIFLVTQSTASAQKDNIKIAERFLKICNSYKYLPLQLSLEYRTTSNYINSQLDTTLVKAEFYTSADKSYVSFGEVEEILEDSLALLVSVKLKRMLLYRDASLIRDNIKSMYDLNVSKANSKKMLESYSFNSIPVKNEQAGIMMKSKSLLHGTSISSETLELQYDVASKNPVQISDIRRELVELSQEEYEALKKNPVFVDELRLIEDRFYIIKELQTLYTYKKIAHETDVDIPVRIAQRISKTASGSYRPVLTNIFQDYVLSEEN